AEAVPRPDGRPSLGRTLLQPDDAGRDRRRAHGRSPRGDGAGDADLARVPEDDVPGAFDARAEAGLPARAPSLVRLLRRYPRRVAGDRRGTPAARVPSRQRVRGPRLHARPGLIAARRPIRSARTDGPRSFDV